MQKQCSMCKVLKDQSEFYRYKNRLQGYCKNCEQSRERKEYKRQLFIKNRDKYRIQAKYAMRAWRERQRNA